MARYSKLDFDHLFLLYYIFYGNNLRARLISTTKKNEDEKKSRPPGSIRSRGSAFHPRLPHSDDRGNDSDLRLRFPFSTQTLILPASLSTARPPPP
jgi:hypothetical protein